MHENQPASGGDSIQEMPNAPSIVFRYALLAVLLYALSLYWGYWLLPQGLGLPLSLAPLLLALLFHNLRAIGLWRHLLAVSLNAIAAGMASSAYFTELSLPLPKESMLVALAVLLLLLIFARLLSARFETKRQQTVICILSTLLFAGALIYLIICWCTHPLRDSIYALLTFHIIFVGFYYLAFFVAATDEEHDPRRLVSFWSFSLTLLLAAVALIALAIAGGDCDCDCGDGCDCGDCSDLRGKKKKQKP